MVRGILLFVALLGTLGLTMGDIETGPTVRMVLPSGLETVFSTGVLVLDNQRVFEAISSQNKLDTSDERIQLDLVDARRQLDAEIVRMEATSMLLTFLGGENQDLEAFSCLFVSQSAPPKCYRL